MNLAQAMRLPYLRDAASMGINREVALGDPVVATLKVAP
jgi:hypothetical protein